MLFSGKMFQGESIRKFEVAFAKYIGVRFAIATSSGTISLYLCLKALGIEKGDEVLLPAYTVPEVVAMILYCGARPVFVDISPITYNIDSSLVEEKISPRTKVLLLTHIYGQPCDIDSFLEIAAKHGLRVIEDAAQACGAEYRGKRAGSFGHLSYFSFGLMKNLNTLGGGAITTNDNYLANRIRKELTLFRFPNSVELIKRFIFVSLIFFFSRPIPFSLFVLPIIRIANLFSSSLVYNLLHAKRSLNFNISVLPEKYKVRFTNFQAFIGLKQLEELDKKNDLRIKNAEILSGLLSGGDFKIPRSLPYVKNIYLNYVLQIKAKGLLIKEFLRRGIDVSSGYIKDCSSMEEFQAFAADCPVSKALFRDNLYLPIHPSLREKHMLYIAESLKKIMRLKPAR